jgi:PIN domain nuclease of toxin-antitoxin system
MKYLLDTHTLLWLVCDSPNLSPKVKELFQSSQNTILFSTAGIWEMALKISINKLTLPYSISEFVEREIRGNSIEVLPIKPSHCFELEGLPFYHRDPFDRMIIAQSMYEKLPIVTVDLAFRKYPIEVVW